MTTFKKFVYFVLILFSLSSWANSCEIYFILLLPLAFLQFLAFRVWKFTVSCLPKAFSDYSFSGHYAIQLSHIHLLFWQKMLSSELPVFQQNLVRRHSAKPSSSSAGNRAHVERVDEIRSPQRGSEKLRGKEPLTLKTPRQTQVLHPVEVVSPVKKTKGLNREGCPRIGHLSLKTYHCKKVSFILFHQCRRS